VEFLGEVRHHICLCNFTHVASFCDYLMWKLYMFYGCSSFGLIAGSWNKIMCIHSMFSNLIKLVMIHSFQNLNICVLHMLHNLNYLGNNLSTRENRKL
jgi:hypothetical protein